MNRNEKLQDRIVIMYYQLATAFASQELLRIHLQIFFSPSFLKS